MLRIAYVLAYTFFLFFGGIAWADVYVITDDKGAVYSISSADDAVIPDGYKKDVLRGKEISDLPLADSEKLYDFNNGKFSINTEKVKERKRAEEAAILAAEEAANIRKSAVDKIVAAAGLTDVEARSLFN